MVLGKQRRLWILTAAVTCASAATAEEPHPVLGSAPLPVEQVVKNLAQRNRQRTEALREVQGTRIYRMRYHGFPSDREAEMTVRMSYRSSSGKVFTVVSESGSKFIVDHIFKKLLESEQEAASSENQRRTALNDENYDFRMQGYESTSSGGQYVLEVIPKSNNKFLYRGKIWVDGKDFAVTRIEAEPAKNLSFWIKKTDIEHKYVQVEGFWLPALNHTECLVRLGGRATLTIEYKEYKVIAAGPIHGLPSAHEDIEVSRTLEQPDRAR
jgi:hypothetical protein